MTHITIEKAKLEQWLEAFEICVDCRPIGTETMTQTRESKVLHGLKTIKAALAQPAQEPVSVTYKEVADAMNSLWNGTLEQHQIAEQMANKKLYTTPLAAPVPMTLWTEAQHERAYRNSPELHKDVKSLAAFKRVAKEVAAMYGITKGQQ